MVDLGLTDNSRSFGTHFLRSKKKNTRVSFLSHPARKGDGKLGAGVSFSLCKICKRERETAITTTRLDTIKKQRCSSHPLPHFKLIGTLLVSS